MISYVLAFFAALVNAPANVLNGKAARDVPAQVQFLAARAHPRPAAPAARAAHTKGFADQFNSGGISAVLSSWQFYACLTVGVVSAWLLENAHQAVPLTASRSGITLVHPVSSTLWGVVVFGDQVNTGRILALTRAAGQGWAGS